jgi:trehalose-6-phosphatase
MTIHNKQLVVWDFDGTNAQILVNTPTLPFFSNNYETLFSISSDKKPQLAKTPLVVN